MMSSSTEQQEQQPPQPLLLLRSSSSSSRFRSIVYLGFFLALVLVELGGFMTQNHGIEVAEITGHTTPSRLLRGVDEPFVYNNESNIVLDEDINNDSTSSSDVMIRDGSGGEEEEMASMEMESTSTSHHHEEEEATTLPRIHILYGLCGNHTGFMTEFEVSLKSILLNAPHHQDTHIHIMADHDAYQYLPTVWEKTGIAANDKQWYRNITITTYNVQGHIEKWSHVLKDGTNNILGEMGGRHTYGTYFRLFANEILPSEVEYALYLDTDVIALANIGQLWESTAEPARQTSNNYPLFFMAGHCAGVMLIHVQKLDMFWDYVRAIEWTRPQLKLMDNAMVNGVRYHFPGSVTELPKEWDLTLARNYREFPQKSKLLEMRPQAGLFHYNGGAGDKETAFEGPIIRRNPDGIGLPAIFYRDLPWTWVHFMGKSAGAGITRNQRTNTKIRVVMAGRETNDSRDATSVL